MAEKLSCTRETVQRQSIGTKDFALVSSGKLRKASDMDGMLSCFFYAQYAYAQIALSYKVYW
jgi:hypothetical protein